ncbi:MAG TPA: DNA internalization-related competence protein ComEC/Rec2 [Desulfuromonadaceae bacterium]|jgi:competence protein ComEC
MLHERPLLFPLFGLAAGLICSELSGQLVSLPIVPAAFSCLLLACFIRNDLALSICTIIFFSIWGMHALSPWKNSPVSPTAIQFFAGHSQITVEGIVGSRPAVMPDGSSFILRTEAFVKDGHAIPAENNLLVYVSSPGDLPFERGDRIRFSTRIGIPRVLGLPGEFDYPRFLLFQGVAAVGRVSSGDEIVLIRGAAEDSLQRRLDMIAKSLGAFIRHAVPDNEVAAVLAALLIGDQKRIPLKLTEAYTKAGVNHILSVSGFHIAIIAFFIVQIALLLATRFETLAIRFNLRRLVLLLSLPAMLMYLFLTGAAPATTRSVIMLIFMVLALYAERESDPINSLLAAALLLLAIHPPSLFDISFQLSFVALWGIVILVPPVMNLFRNMKVSWQRSLLQFVITSCIASLVTAVPVLFIFNQASLNGILSNFVIVPLLGYGAVLIGFCSLPFVYVFEPFALALLWMAGKIVWFSNKLILLFAKLPLLQFYCVSRLDMAAFLGLMISLTFVANRRIKLAMCGLLPSLAILAHASAPSSADGRLHISMLSVGQAESLLIKLPDGGTMLVDGGGYLQESDKDFGQRTLVPALHKMGVHRIDRLILTHSHPDHIGGLPFVSSAFSIGEFWEAAPGGVGKQYEQVRLNLLEKKVPMRQLAAGDKIKLGSGVSISVLSPQLLPAPALKSRDDHQIGLNDESLVFKLEYGNFSMLFTADAGLPAEDQMLNNRINLRSTILKVGHHGSRFSTSSKFLDQIQPKAALISSGFNNNFGLPSPATLKLLEKRGVATYRTDRDGTIEVVSDGKTWQIFTPFRL